jgi:hypothetical protein
MARYPAYPAVRVELFPYQILTKPVGAEESTNRFDFCEVIEDKAGRIWAGTEAGEVLCFNRPKPPAYYVRVPGPTSSNSGTARSA